MKATLTLFIGSQITGCLTGPFNSDIGSVIRSASQAIEAVSGSARLTVETFNGLANTFGTLPNTQAPSTIRTRVGYGASPIGNPAARYNNPSYTSSEFQNIYARFKSAKSVIEANPQRFTQRQFFAFSGALADMMRYIDAIGVRGERRASLQRPANAHWADFYAEALAEAEPIAQSGLLMGSGLVNAQIDSRRMLAQGPSRMPPPVSQPPPVAQKPPVSQPPPVAQEAPVSQPPPVAHTPATAMDPPARRVLGSEPVKTPAQLIQEAEAVEAAVIEDLKDLAYKEAFNQFLDKDTPMLKALKKKFTSQKAQLILTSIPVAGNILNLAMLAQGTNLDGSPMDKWDYAAAAIGVIPVAGNIASKLGPGASVLTAELRAAHVYLKNRQQYEYGIEAIGSELGEIFTGTGLAWLDRQYSNISNTVLSSFPQTTEYIASNNIKI